MGSDLERLVEAAKEGDKKALETLILKIQDKIYGLALRMLYNPSDAEDASQEILLKIITHLGTFRGESAFTTWMYRVAVNHLLTSAGVGRNWSRCLLKNTKKALNWIRR